MVIVAFSVLMGLGWFLLITGMRKKGKELNDFKPAIVCMALSVLLYSSSFLWPVENDFIRIGLSYASVLFGILFVLTALSASTAGKYQGK
ncbi:hypothetical protein BTO30_10675 [Domibacillus antri]|uniref:Uncharacterized protein n=1 Tax=Domibacillus antri TaxID=1714264 RepID=A0A1Q8Q4J1_9BACI|nr:hypothetical protein [Domibacillus antri]OLN22205.1 hypothetical protein BTO30_10675 [Domibacillus antri]